MEDALDILALTLTPGASPSFPFHLNPHVLLLTCLPWPCVIFIMLAQLMKLCDKNVVFCRVVHRRRCEDRTWVSQDVGVLYNAVDGIQGLPICSPAKVYPKPFVFGDRIFY